jgi:soluble lytic murein transglycosylase-like protein
VDDDSHISLSAGTTVSGIFSLIIISFLVVFPWGNIQDSVDPVIKGPRPYKQGITTACLTSNHPSLKTAKRESIFHSIILEASNRHKVDPALVKAIIMVESGYNPMAISKKGAVGLMQIMPATADALGVEDLFDPAHNVNAGVSYFKKLLNQFGGDLKLALAAYNAGSRKVREYRGIPPYGATRHYVKKVFEYYQYYQGRKI